MSNKARAISAVAGHRRHFYKCGYRRSIPLPRFGRSVQDHPSQSPSAPHLLLFAAKRITSRFLYFCLFGAILCWGVYYSQVNFLRSANERGDLFKGSGPHLTGRIRNKKLPQIGQTLSFLPSGHVEGSGFFRPKI